MLKDRGSKRSNLLPGTTSNLLEKRYSISEMPNELPQVEEESVESGSIRKPRTRKNVISDSDNAEEIKENSSSESHDSQKS